MCLSRFALTIAAVFAVLGAAPAFAQPDARGTDDGMQLAAFVEARASSTTFAALEAFGHDAMRRTGSTTTPGPS